MSSRRVVLTTLLLPLLAACGSGSPQAVAPAAARATTTAPAPTPAPLPVRTQPAVLPPSPTRAPATAQPHPAYPWSVRRVSAADLPHSWHPGCPVAPSALRMLTLRYRGFDGAPHDGHLVVSARLVASTVQVFRDLYTARFPIRRMIPVDAYGGSDDASVAADNTAAFNCRLAVGSGPPTWSRHAYGGAIDVDPVENPYLEGSRVIPPAGAAYSDRGDVRPGMAEPHGTLVLLFARHGWRWGGTWSHPDYQHFSDDGQ